MILVKSRKSGGGGLVAFIAKQGLVYYILNVAVYVTWGFMLIFAPAGSKYLMGGPVSGIACVSVNRLTLHLRSYSSDSEPGPSKRSEALPTFATVPNRQRRRRNSWLGASTFEGLDTLVDLDEGSSSSVEMRDIVPENR